LHGRRTGFARILLQNRHLHFSLALDNLIRLGFDILEKVLIIL